MTDKELKEFTFELDKRIEKLRESQEKTDEQIKETGEQMKETDRKLNKVAKLVGNIANNQGDVAEEYFINSLEDNMELLGMHFDTLSANLHRRKNNIEDEYNIVLVNGENIAIIEVKYKVHENDVKKLDKKIETFKETYAPSLRAA